MNCLHVLAVVAAVVSGETEIDGPGIRSGKASRKIRELTVPLGSHFLNAEPANRQVV